MVKTANEIFRDYETDGVPSSGAHKPIKGDIRDLLNNFPSTFSTFQIGTSPFPTGPSSNTSYKRVDSTSWTITNTISARTAQIGSASKDGITWVESIVPGTDGPGIVSLYSISDTGNYSTVSAIRSSDNTQTTPQNIIADISVARHDNPTVAHNVWGRYSHGWWDSGAATNGFLLNEESSICNLGPNATKITPHSLILGSSNAGQKANLRLTAGTGLVVGNKVSCAIQITNNNAKFVSGIVFGTDSLDTSSGYADAISLAINHGLTIYDETSNLPAWKIFSNDTTGTTSAGNLIFGNGKIQLINSNFDITSSSNFFSVAGTKVLGQRKTGWSADTGTANRGSNLTYSDTASAIYSQSQLQSLMNGLTQVTQTVKALKDDFISHGAIGT